MADRAQGVADLVGDAAGQAAERGLLHLHHLAHHAAAVVEEDQGAAVRRRPEPGEARQDAALGLGEAQRSRTVGRVDAPVPQPLGQFRRQFREIARLGVFRQAEQRARRGVDQANARVGVDHHDPGLQAADDVVVELREVGQVESALGGDRLALPEVAGQPARHQRGGEEHRAMNPGLGVVGVAEQRKPLGVDLFAEDAQRGQCGVEQGHLAGHQHATRRDRDRQQHAEAARQAAAGVHHQGQRGDVDQQHQRDLHPELRLAPRDQGEAECGEHQVADARLGEQPGVERAEQLRSEP